MLNRYLVKDGAILDVLDGSEKKADILVENGMIRRIGEDLSAAGAEILRADGMTITTGWVDDHVHIYSDVENSIGISAERYLLPFGVTYAVDPGTAGADNFEDFRRHVYFHTDLRYRSFLNLSRIGVPICGAELEDMTNLDEDACRRVFRQYREEMIGLKVRISDDVCADPLKALRSLRAMADELEATVCVHATRCSLPTETILGFLRKGDMLTHCYARTSSGILEESGMVRRSVWEARERGVVFDVGHGVGSFSFDTAERAIAQGFLAETLSTDLHAAGISGPVFDMPTTVSKFLAMGMDLREVLRMITVNPVRALHLTDKQLRIREGSRADFTVFSIEEGSFLFSDSEKQERIGPYRVRPAFTCLGERVYFPTRIREKNRRIGRERIKEATGEA